MPLRKSINVASLLKISAVAAAIFGVAVNGHMRLHSPAPLAGDNNPHRADPADEKLDYPYNCCGEVTPFPCRGYLDLLGTDQGRPTATWTAGSVQNLTLIGKGTHWGGSCQAGFSVDGGGSWKAVNSWEGNCPYRSADPSNPAAHSYEITVPADMPTGDHVFAWTWFNREQEFFMSCATVSVTGGAQVVPREPIVPFNELPGLLVANVEEVDNGCTSPPGRAEVRFPNPGPNVVEGDGAYPLEFPSPVESCMS